jgi:hypothetical protein
MNTTNQKTAIKATIEGMKLTLSFAHGPQIEINAGELSDDIFNQAVMHGLKQKLVDAAAISRNPDTGLSATIADKFDAVRTVYDRLIGGEWNAIRVGGGNSGGLLYRALVRLYGERKTPEQLKEYLNSKTDAEKAALRKNPKIAAIIVEIQAENADDSIDSDELLAGLED